MKKVGKVLKIMGAILIVGAAALAYKNIEDEKNAAAAASQLGVMVQQNIEEAKSIYADASLEVVPDYVLNPEMDMPVVSIGAQNVIGELSIPAIDLVLPIQSDWDVTAAKRAPCRYKGSCYTNDMIIAGHNYRTHFKALTQLKEGDEVVFVDMDGNEFRYKVAQMETIDGYDIQTMESGDWDLTLFTCTYGGKLRYTVRCLNALSDI